MHPHPTLSWYDLAAIAAAVVAGSALLERRLVSGGDRPGWSRALDRILLDQRVDELPDVDDEPAVRLVRPCLYDQDDPENRDQLDPGLVRWRA